MARKKVGKPRGFEKPPPGARVEGRKRGRPPSYPPHFVVNEELNRLLEGGAVRKVAIANIARKWNTSPRTIERWLADMRKAGARAKLFWAAHLPPDLQAKWGRAAASLHDPPVDGKLNPQ